MGSGEWGDICEKTAKYILHATFLHCSLPHLAPSTTCRRDYRTQCKHPHTLSLLRRGQAYSARQAVLVLVDPPIINGDTHHKSGTLLRHYSDIYCSLAPLVLEDGHTLLGCHQFTQPVAEQCCQDSSLVPNP